MKEIRFKFVIRTGDVISVTESYDLCDLMDYVNVLCEYSADEILYELQYTGIKNKNGVEIYEGDILKCENHHTWVVSFNDRSCFIAHAPEQILDFVLLDDYDFEVIGNIYENHDLLGESK